jgi:hypothetical protein
MIIQVPVIKISALIFSSLIRIRISICNPQLECGIRMRIRNTVNPSGSVTIQQNIRKEVPLAILSLRAKKKNGNLMWVVFIILAEWQAQTLFG